MFAQSGSGRHYPDDWLYELKLDGVRCITFLSDDTRLQGRSGNNLTALFPELKDLHKQAGRPCILDGEIICEDFKAIQRRVHKVRAFDIRMAAREYPAVYYAFDVLEIDGESTMRSFQLERKERLASVFRDGEKGRILPYQVGAGEALHVLSRAQKLEGIMAKSPRGIYVPGWRGNVWLKIKNFQTGTFLVCGVTAGESARESTFGSLILAEEAEGRLVYVGSVGSGFTEKEQWEILKLLGEAKRGSASLEADPGKPVLFWTRPVFKVEVQYLEKGSDGKLRFPSFKGLTEGR